MGGALENDCCDNGDGGDSGGDYVVLLPAEVGVR